MNHAKSLVGMIFAGLIAVGCSGGTKSASPEDFNKALSDAKMALSQAKKAQNEWRDTGKIIKKAEAAAKSGDYDKATGLANKAKRQSELALIQAKNQQGAGPM